MQFTRKYGIMDITIRTMLKTQRAGLLRQVEGIEKALEMESTTKLKERVHRLKGQIYKIRRWADERGIVLPIE